MEGLLQRERRDGSALHYASDLPNAPVISQANLREQGARARQWQRRLELLLTLVGTG